MVTPALGTSWKQFCRNQGLEQRSFVVDHSHPKQVWGKLYCRNHVSEQKNKGIVGIVTTSDLYKLGNENYKSVNTVETHSRTSCTAKMNLTLWKSNRVEFIPARSIATAKYACAPRHRKLLFGLQNCKSASGTAKMKRKQQLVTPSGNGS